MAAQRAHSPHRPECCVFSGWGRGSWEHEKSRRALKWREEQRKESYTKDDSEKDSDPGEDQPDLLEPPEVASARESIAALVGEQKKLREQKVHRAWGFKRGSVRSWGSEGQGDLAIQATIPGDLAKCFMLYGPYFLICKMGPLTGQSSWGC